MQACHADPDREPPVKPKTAKKTKKSAASSDQPTRMVPCTVLLSCPLIDLCLPRTDSTCTAEKQGLTQAWLSATYPRWQHAAAPAAPIRNATTPEVCSTRTDRSAMHSSSGSSGQAGQEPKTTIVSSAAANSSSTAAIVSGAAANSSSTAAIVSSNTTD